MLASRCVRLWLVKSPGRSVSASNLMQALGVASAPGMPWPSTCITSADGRCEIGPEQIRRLARRREERQPIRMTDFWGGS